MSEQQPRRLFPRSTIVLTAAAVGIAAVLVGLGSAVHRLRVEAARLADQ